MANNSGTFWTDAQNIYARRNNLFFVEFDFASGNQILEKASGVQVVAKSVSLPSFSFSQTEKDRNSIGGTSAELVSGFLDWEPVTLTFSDVISRQKVLEAERKATAAAVDATAREALGNSPFSPFAAANSLVTSAKAYNASYKVAEYDDYLYRALMFAFERSLNSSVYQGSQVFNRERVRRFFNRVEIVSIDDRGFPVDRWTLERLFPTAFENSSLSYEDDAIREFSVTFDYMTAKYTSYKSDGSTESKVNFKNTETPDSRGRSFGGSIK